MTYGRLRFNLKRRFPSVDLDTIEDSIHYRYQDILDRLRWTRETEPVKFNTVAEVAGSLAATNGSNVIVGNLAVWSPEMNGSMIRISARGEFYTFTSANQIPPSFNVGTLDRAFIGDTGSAQSYRINKNYYLFPQALNINGVVPLDHSDPLEYLTREDAARVYPNRNSYGRPVHWTKVFVDNAATEPTATMGVELLPVPTEVRSYSASVELDSDVRVAAVVKPDDNFLTWVRGSVLEHGCAADLERRMKDRPAALDEEALYQKGIDTMIELDLRRRGPQTMRMSRDYVTDGDFDNSDDRHYHR